MQKIFKRKSLIQLFQYPPFFLDIERGCIPVAINGKVEIRPIMYVALSYDHRIIDGRESVSFLVKVKQQLENPMLMLFEGKDPMKKLLGL